MKISEERRDTSDTFYSMTIELKFFLFELEIRRVILLYAFMNYTDKNTNS